MFGVVPTHCRSDGVKNCLHRQMSPLPQNYTLLQSLDTECLKVLSAQSLLDLLLNCLEAGVSAPTFFLNEVIVFARSWGIRYRSTSKVASYRPQF